MRLTRGCHARCKVAPTDLAVSSSYKQLQLERQELSARFASTVRLNTHGSTVQLKRYYNNFWIPVPSSTMLQSMLPLSLPRPCMDGVLSIDWLSPHPACLHARMQRHRLLSNHPDRSGISTRSITCTMEAPATASGLISLAVVL